MVDQSNSGLFSGSQIKLEVELINALLRVAQTQQQQEWFVPSSQINDTVYTAPSERNCSVTTTLFNSTLASSQHYIGQSIQEWTCLPQILLGPLLNTLSHMLSLDSCNNNN